MSSDMTLESEHDSGQPPEFFLFLADLIQLYALNDNPSILMVTSSYGERASISIADSRVIHAQFGDLTGTDALHQILRWEKGELSRRTIRRSSVISIQDDLSTTLMRAYEHVIAHGVLSPDLDRPPDTLSLASSLEEMTSTILSDEVRQTLTGSTDYKHYFRLVWGENLRNELKSIDGFVSFQLLDVQGNSHLRSTLAENSATLAEHMFTALRESGVIEERLELYLTLAASYHAFLRLPLGDHILYAVFELDETTPAMVQFKLKQIIENLPHPQPKSST